MRKTLLYLWNWSLTHSKITHGETRMTFDIGVICKESELMPCSGKSPNCKLQAIVSWVGRSSPLLWEYPEKAGNTHTHMHAHALEVDLGSKSCNFIYYMCDLWPCDLTFLSLDFFFDKILGCGKKLNENKCLVFSPQIRDIQQMIIIFYQPIPHFLVLTNTSPAL